MTFGAFRHMSLVFAGMCSFAIVSMVAVLCATRHADDDALQRVGQIGGKWESGEMLNYDIITRDRFTAISCGSPPVRFPSPWWFLNRTPPVIYSVDLAGCRVSDEDAAVISRLRNCSILVLSGAVMSKVALLKLMTIADVEVVDLRGVPVDGGVLELLKGRRDLRHVAISDTMIDPKALDDFRKESRAEVILLPQR